MTIEAERTKSKFLGLKKTIKTRLLDFRQWSERTSPSMTFGKHPDTILFHKGPILSGQVLPDKYVFATPLSEDDLEVRTKSSLLEEGVSVIYSKEKINEANLVSDEGERLTWRETQPGDYPPIKPGQELRPIQQNLRLI